MFSRRKLLGSASALAGGLVAGLGFPQILKLESSPNVLLICIDTLRRDRLGCAGCELGLTPFIDNLAESGVFFPNAVAVSSWTKPSVASIMTGLHPLVHGANDWSSVLPEEASCLSTILKRNGYATFCVQTNPWLGAEHHGFETGYDYFKYLPYTTRPGRTPDVKQRFFADAASVLKETLKAAKSICRSGRKWFGYLHFMDPHGPYVPPREFLDRVPLTDLDADAATPLEQIGTASGKVFPDKQLRNLWRRRYNASVLFTDAMICRLYRELHTRGFMKNTVVVICADHGEEFWEHGRSGHGKTLYNEVLDVPLLITGADVPRGVVPDRCARHVDIVPTVLDLAGIDVEHPFDGVSLLRRDATGVSAAFASLFPIKREAQMRSVRDFDTGLKLVSNENGDRRWHELYDLTDDPLERRDLSEKMPRELISNQRRLQAFEAEAAGRALARREGSLSSDTRRQLEALGYLQ